MTTTIQTADIEIVRGSVDDAAALAEFAAQTFEATFAAANNPEDLHAHRSAHYGHAQQAKELADPDVITILARSGGTLIAHAQVRRNSPPPCVTQASPIELHRFYLARAAQGSGLAWTLMREVHRAAQEFGGRHVWLGVWEHNPRAIAFYSKAKFVDVGSQVYMVGQDRQLDRVLVAAVDSELMPDRPSH